MAHVWPFFVCLFPLLLRLISVGVHFWKGLDFPLSRSRPHLLWLLNFEIGSLWVGDQGCLAWKPWLQSESIRAPEPRMVKAVVHPDTGRFLSQVLPQRQHLFVGREAWENASVAIQLPPVSLAKFPIAWGLCSDFREPGGKSWGNLFVEAAFKKKKCLLQKKRTHLWLGSNCFNIVKSVCDFLKSVTLEHCLTWILGVTWESQILQIVYDSKCFAL